MATWRARGAGKAAAPGARLACLLAVVLAVSAVGCTATGPLSTSNSVKRDLNSMGCYLGTFRLHISPANARPGQTVTLAANGPQGPGGGVSTGSWGVLGAASDGHFAAAYDLAAITPGLRHQQNVPAGASGGLGGVGLPNRAFGVRVPPVPVGNYVIQFAYSVAPGSMGNTEGPTSYTLCARLHVDR
jgi:hypothetical protein